MNNFFSKLKSLNPSEVDGINLMRNENFVIPKLDFSGINPCKYPAENDLLNLISGKHNIDKKNILICAGSTEALEISIRAYLYSGKFGLVEKISYAPIENMIKRTGANVCYEYKSNPTTKIIVNPNNPTGEIKSSQEIKEDYYSKKYEAIIIDEAYFDYLSEDESCIRFSTENENLIVTRTFSKLYGLAGLRIGFLVAHEKTIKNLKKILNPYGVSSFSISAAIQVLKDEDHIKNSLFLNKKSLDILLKGLSYLKIQTLNPCANFVSAKIPVQIKGYSMRDLEFYSGLKGWKRISTCAPEIMEKFILDLKKEKEKTNDSW